MVIQRSGTEILPHPTAVSVEPQSENTVGDASEPVQTVELPPVVLQIPDLSAPPRPPAVASDTAATESQIRIDPPEMPKGHVTAPSGWRVLKPADMLEILSRPSSSYIAGGLAVVLIAVVFVIRSQNSAPTPAAVNPAVNTTAKTNGAGPAQNQFTFNNAPGRNPFGDGGGGQSGLWAKQAPPTDHADAIVKLPPTNQQLAEQNPHILPWRRPAGDGDQPQTQWPQQFTGPQTSPVTRLPSSNVVPADQNPPGSAHSSPNARKGPASVARLEGSIRTPRIRTNHDRTR